MSRNNVDANTPNDPDRNIGLAEFRCLFGIPQGHDCLVTQPPDPNQKRLPIAEPTITVTATNRSRVLVFLRVLSNPSFATRPKVNKPKIKKSKANAQLQATGQPGQPQVPGQQQAQAQQNQADEETALLIRYDAKSEYATSVYMQIVQEESDQMRLYHLYNFITYFFLIVQVIIGALTALLSSLALLDPGSAFSRRLTIAVASLGAATAVLTGVLSLLKGQGLPIRLQQFASRLRQVREKIEIKEKVLRMSTTSNANGSRKETTIKLSEALEIWDEYQNVIRERDINRPDAWATSVPVTREPAETRTRGGNVGPSADTVGPTGGTTGPARVRDESLMTGGLQGGEPGEEPGHNEDANRGDQSSGHERRPS